MLGRSTLLLLLALHARSADAASRASPSTPTAKRETTFARSAIAGGAAAAAATVVFHPVDTAKTVLQQDGAAAALRGLGVRGLYKGVLPAAFSMMPACAVRMGAYEALKAALLTHATTLSPGASVVLASASSVVVSCSVRAPLDMVKTQVQTGAAGSVRAALTAAWGKGGLEGVAGLYRGAGLALLRDVPFFSINLLAYERLKESALAAAAARAGGPVELSAKDVVLVGAAAQGIAGFSTNPMDALKTRVQASAGLGVRGAYLGVMAEAGPAGLMRGAWMRVAWIAPQGCVYYPVYEAVQRALAPK